MLPHFQQPGQAYFVTWSLKDAVPEKALKRYSDQLEILKSQIDISEPSAGAADSNQLISPGVADSDPLISPGAADSIPLFNNNRGMESATPRKKPRHPEIKK